MPVNLQPLCLIMFHLITPWTWMTTSTGLSEAWQLVESHCRCSSKTEETLSATPPNLKIGDRDMVYMPQEKKGKKWKLSRPYHGPDRVLEVTSTNAKVRLIDCPDDEPIFVSLSRVQPCHFELPGVSMTCKEKMPKRGGGQKKLTLGPLSQPLSFPIQYSKLTCKTILNFVYVTTFITFCYCSLITPRAHAQQGVM